jgi:hypothetical protein
MEALFSDRFKRYWLYAQLMDILNAPPEPDPDEPIDE